MTSPAAHRVRTAGAHGVRLVAIDLPAGSEFVDWLQRIWDRGDAAFPVEQRLPSAARAAVLDAIAPDSAVGPDGQEVRLDPARRRPGLLAGDALVVATSGSTGMPKGVVLTHDAIAASAKATSRHLGVAPGDRWLACLPLSHIGGLSVVTRALHTATPLVVHPRFEPPDVERAARDGATLVSLVRTALERIDPAWFRAIVLGGAAPPEGLPPNVTSTYGLTETGSGVVYDGVPLPGVEVRLDETGQVLVRGPMLLRCYRDGSSPVDADGWLATGDQGRWDRDGRLRVLGRRGDMIVTGGENVWPEPVERLLRTHPLVADVAVAGTDDPEWGQVVTAYVVPGAQAPTLDQLRDVVKAELPGYCAPRRLELVAAIPRTSLGKPRRAALGSTGSD